MIQEYMVYDIFCSFKVVLESRGKIWLLIQLTNSVTSPFPELGCFIYFILFFLIIQFKVSLSLTHTHKPQPIIESSSSENT